MATSFDKKLLKDLSRTPIEASISGDALASVLGKSPFVSLPGALNLRDVGAFAPRYVKPGVVFRSGMLDFIPATELAQIGSQLRITNIFDFRREDEVRQPVAKLQGIKLVSCPYMDGAEMPAPVVVSDFASQDDGSISPGYSYMYETILQGYKTGFKRVLEGVLASEDEAVLFHCTAGKDRTGIMAALILDLMGAPVEVIADEYALTRIGTEPFREILLPAAIKSFGAVLGSKGGSPRSHEDVVVPGLTTLGMRELLSTSAETMAHFIDHLHSTHGGAYGYIKGELGMSEADIQRVRRRLDPGGCEDAS